MTSARSEIRKDINLMEYWRILWKHKTFVLTALGVCLVLAAVLSFTQTPLYEATSQILIEDQGSNRFNLQDFLNTPTGNTNDFLGTFFNTQLRIILSRSLAERVVKKINLGSRSEFKSALGGRRTLIDMVKFVVTFRWLRSKSRNPEGVDDQILSGVEADSLYAGILLKKLAVRPVPETRLVDVSFVSPYSRFAAEVVNTLVQEYIDYDIESRSEATQQTSDFLNQQITLLKGELDSKERQLQRYQEEKKILPLSEKDSNTASQYGAAATAYSNAQIARIGAESKFRELQKLRVDALPQNVSDPTIQALRTTYLQTKSEYDEKIQTYTPNHPDMVQLRIKVETQKSQLQSEITKAVDAANSQYSQALDNENRLKQMLEGKRSEVTQQNNESLLYVSLKSEVGTLKDLITRLITDQQTNQVSTMLGGLKTSKNIKIIDQALIPEKPFSPNIPRNLILSVLLGLILGVGMAFIAHFLDNTVKNPDDLDKLTGLPSLGFIPHFSTDGAGGQGIYASPYGDSQDQNDQVSKIAEVELINHLFPKIAIAEDYRTVRTSILFSRVDSDHKIIAFTSSQPQEGKSATIANIAISFAQLGERVLTIDADLRKPRLHKIFKINNDFGLSDVLTGRLSLEEAVQKTPVAHFSLLPSGPHPPNPAELLNSKRMKELLATVRLQYEIVLIDLPPVLAVIDPVIVAAMADMTIIVLKTGKTTRKPLLRTIEELRKAKARITGVIFNDAEVKKNAFYTPYFQYEYYQDSVVDTENIKTPTEKRD